MRSIRLGLTIALWALLTCGTARADFMYQFAFDQANYNVAPGGTVDVQVFLQETVSGGSTSRLSSDGLISAGVKVRFDESAPSDPAKILATADMSFNPAFNSTVLDLRTLSAGTSGQLTEAVGLGSPAVHATGGPTTFSVLVGTYHFTAGSTAGQVTHLRATLPSLASNVTGTGLRLDPLIGDGSATITTGAQVVPEPSSLVLLAIGVLSTCCFTWRRRLPLQAQAWRARWVS
jgi:hypothetical protein